MFQCFFRTHQRQGHFYTNGWWTMQSLLRGILECKMPTADSFSAFCLHHKMLHDTWSGTCRIYIKLMLHIFILESIHFTLHMEPQLMQTCYPLLLEYCLGMKTGIAGSNFGNFQRCSIHIWTTRRYLL